MKITGIKKIAVVLLAATIALAGLVVGYGRWTDRIDIVATTANPVGSFCWGFFQVETLDRCPNGSTPGTIDYTCDSPDHCPDTFHQLGDEPGDAVPKDVGCTKAYKTDQIPSCPTCWNGVEVELYNTYPSYASKTTIGFKNCGDYSVKIEREWIETQMPGYTYVPYMQTMHTKCGWLRNPDGEDVLDICWINYEGETLSSGEKTVGELVVHVLQPADQGLSGADAYKFRVAIESWAVP
jgi:hypothetical protein